MLWVRSCRIFIYWFILKLTELLIIANKYVDIPGSLHQCQLQRQWFVWLQGSGCTQRYWICEYCGAMSPTLNKMDILDPFSCWPCSLHVILFVVIWIVRWLPASKRSLLLLVTRTELLIKMSSVESMCGEGVVRGRGMERNRGPKLNQVLVLFKYIYLLHFFC